MAEASFKVKPLELNAIKQRTTTTEKARELAKQKVEGLQSKLGKAEIKLTEAMSIVSARDKDLADLKEIMKTCEQVYYNMGFKDAEN